MKIECPRMVVAGTHSGVGKTSITLALVASLSRRGLRVPPFRLGLDYLDCTRLARSDSIDCYNLDGRGSLGTRLFTFTIPTTSRLSDPLAATCFVFRQQTTRRCQRGSRGYISVEEMHFNLAVQFEQAAPWKDKHPRIWDYAVFF